MDRVRIFFIGFDHCGTRSFTELFKCAGFKTYHGGDFDPLSLLVKINMALGRRSLDGLENYDVYSDSHELAINFMQLDHDYRVGSKFVLNTRDVTRWIVSRLNHGSGDYISHMNRLHHKRLEWMEWAEIWRSDFLEHELRVVQYFRGRDDVFLRFDIETDKLSKLRDFLGWHFLPEAEKLPQKGKTSYPIFVADGDKILRARGHSATRAC